ncbi:hypothetical protein HanPSC8_Chr10g0411011 [Helianthus annuus]|nr:hypothetical protein HanPSC8_Chr10g0411011 [Helianthus annuus]
MYCILGNVMCTFGIWKQRLPLPRIPVTCKTLELPIYSFSQDISLKQALNQSQAIT